MGEVYRATDTRLSRDVALKVLPPEMAYDADRLARFQREANILAQLDHPNIVTIYSVENCEGVHFLTMQLVQGAPLDRLISGPGLSLDQVIRLAEMTADALDAAHQKGIIHRDLKPANIMVTDSGSVKVLDFGLAKNVRDFDDATIIGSGHTQIGAVMGTPAYMSPEQATGRPLDHRTDIFSLGVILHEVSTGKHPFSGSSSAELISSILRDTPASVTDLRSDFPPDLARIVRRCLEKEPRHRLQTARDVSNELRELSQSLTATSSRTAATDSGEARAAEGFWVAVLPFKYKGSDAHLASFAEGLSDEVITGLSRFSYLRVITRASTATCACNDARDVGKELGARYVMEGSLRVSGSRLRLTVQLADTLSGAHLWAETYDRAFTPDSIFDIQDDLVPRIVSTVADQYGVLTRSMSEIVSTKDESSLSPFEAVLRGFRYFARLTPQEHGSVRDVLERMTRKAPNHADCFGMLAMMYIVEYSDSYNALPDPLGRALAAAQRATDLAPSHALGHYALAWVYFFRKQTPYFEASVQRALALNPMDASVLGMLGVLVQHAVDWDRGCDMVDQAYQLNPNLPGIMRFAYFSRAYRKRQYAEALEAAIRINMPGFFYYHAALAGALGQLGQLDAAHKAAQDTLALRPDFPETAPHEYTKWYEPADVDHFMAGLRKAGLPIPTTSIPTAAAATSR